MTFVKILFLNNLALNPVWLRILAMAEENITDHYMKNEIDKVMR